MFLFDLCDIMRIWRKMRVLIGKDFPEFRTKFHFFHQHVLKSAANMVLDIKNKTRRNLWPEESAGLRCRRQYIMD